MPAADPFVSSARRGARALPRHASTILLCVAIAGLAWLAVVEVHDNLTARRIGSGFGFLSQPSGIPMDDTPIPYRVHVDTYFRAVLVGIVNTLTVSGAGIVLATVLGVAVGLVRLSKHPLLAMASRCYVELFRNVPILLQLMFWYILLLHMPAVRQALTVGDWVFVSNRGLSLPSLRFQADAAANAAAVVALGAALLLPATLRRRNRGSWFLLAIIAVAITVVATRMQVDLPRKAGFAIAGGLSLSTEFSALLLGLTIYFSTYIGEIVRAGIESIPPGQSEAAAALGLSGPATLRLVVIPQALRLIVPPTTSQYANLVKTSSLAVTIGYQDVVSTINAIINQTGQAVEGVLLIAVVYSLINLGVSLLLRLIDERLPGLSAARGG